MEKQTADIAAELVAIRYVLEQVGKIAFITAGLTVEHATAMRERAQTVLRAETFPGLEAVWSDHLAAEIADHVDALLSGIEENMRVAYQSAGQR